jgi:lipopolysaccharide/colanic/teichoic acid biosynthesis glycosyltransferase
VISVKRLIDILFSATILALSSPLLFIIAIAVWLDSGWPIFFAQERVGRDFRPFDVWKFRTMTVVNHGPRLTVRGDPRITRIGKRLRSAKLDELPQFVNVLCGHMSVVGPRPEVEEHVRLYEERFRKVLTLRPGITDLASIQFRDEEEILSQSTDPIRTYREKILPAKLDLAEAYLETHTLMTDLRIVLRTVFVVLTPRGSASRRCPEASTQ